MKGEEGASSFICHDQGAGEFPTLNNSIVF